MRIPSFHRAAAVGLLAALVAGPSAAQQKEPEKKTPAPAAYVAPTKGPYLLRPGDEVAVTVTPQKDFSIPAARILPDGKVYLRNIGGFPAGGKTVEELRKQVLKALEQELIEPKVTVRIIRLAPELEPETPEEPELGVITVVGAVQRGGPQPLPAGLRLRKALDLAGGAAEDADLTKISILHKDLQRTIVDLSTPEKVLDPKMNVVLQDLDSIEVPRLPSVQDIIGKVRIAGQVEKPGQYDLKPGMSLQELILGAGKLSNVADLERVELRHEGQASTINLRDQMQKGLEGKIVLAAGDEVFVPQAKAQVTLIGPPTQSGPYPLKPNQKVRDFLVLGAPQVQAAFGSGVNLKKVELIRPGQKTRQLNVENVLKKEEDKDNIELASGDILFLHPRVQKTPRSTKIINMLSNFSAISTLFGLF
jgi:protein involved in polysaccharide export with SLBB domain